MYSNMRGDVVALHGSCVAGSPLASQVQVVGTLATDVALTNVFLNPKIYWLVFFSLVAQQVKETRSKDQLT